MTHADKESETLFAHPLNSPARPAAERNWLLGALTPEEYETVRPYLECVTLTPEQRLGPAHEAIPFVYFPQSGVVSLIRRMHDGTEIEVGTVGAEGMSGLGVYLGGDEMPTSCVVQIAGSAQRVSAANLQKLARAGGPLREVLACYAQYMFGQAGLAVACARLHSLDQRCARWLLTTHDRVGAGRFALTQEHLAALLGVRRAGISAAQQSLERLGAIKYARGKIEVLDRVALEGEACECYRADIADFDRHLGSAGRRRPQVR